MSSGLLHLTPRPFSILPDHPLLDERSPPRPHLRKFLHSALADTHHFLSSIPDTFQDSGKPRTSPPSFAPVQVSTRLIRAPPTEKAGKSKDEFWACRKSTHENAPVTGSASWEEFRAGLRENHVENEKEYTPSVTAVENLLKWPVEMEIEGGWRDVDMQVNMITHTFHPTALISPRTFISLSISADFPDSLAKGFLTLQVPLADKPVDSIPGTLREKITASAPKKAIFASYASVEQLVSVSDQLEWTMATTSDAGGAIPQWIQRSWTMGGVSKAIVADVGLFVRWMDQGRKKR